MTTLATAKAAFQTAPSDESGLTYVTHLFSALTTKAISDAAFRAGMTEAGDILTRHRPSPVQTTDLTNAYHVRRDTPEWTAIWDALGREIVARNLGTGQDLVQRSGDGEIWEYLGSRSYGGGSLCEHGFRHRNHPMTHVRESFDVTICDAEDEEPGR